MLRCLGVYEGYWDSAMVQELYEYASKPKLPKSLWHWVPITVMGLFGDKVGTLSRYHPRLLLSCRAFSCVKRSYEVSGLLLRV